jgi:hypothetical protein
MIEPRHLCAKKAPDENGAGERSRTPDRLITNQLLYQLSYASNNQTGLSYSSPIEAGRIVEKGCGGCNYWGDCRRLYPNTDAVCLWLVANIGQFGLSLPKDTQQGDKR